MIKDFSILYSDRVYSSLLYFCAVHRIPFGIMKQYLDIHGTDDVEGAVRSYRRGVMKSGKKKKLTGFYFDGVYYTTFRSACERLNLDYEEAMIYKIGYPQLSEKEILSDLLGRHSK